MSLIQVSSTQKLLNNQSGGQGTFNKGYDFTNYFASNVNIPPNCEIALHNGIFTMEDERNINFANLQLSAGGNQPCMSRITEKSPGDYAFMVADITDQETGSGPLHLPLLYNVNPKMYDTIASFWKEMTEILNTDPRPENIWREALTSLGILASGLESAYSSFGGTGTMTLTKTTNGCTAANVEAFADPDRSGFRNYSPNPVDICELQNFATPVGFPYPTCREIEKTTLNSRSKDRPAVWTTQFNGVHTAGGKIEARNLASSAVSLTDGSIPKISRHQFCLGARRWADPGWLGADAYMNSALDFDYFQEYAGTPEMKPYLFMDKILNGNARPFAMYPQVVGEFCFWFAGKCKIHTTGLNPSLDVTGFYKEQAMYIFKFECGGNFEEEGVYNEPRWICVATGDPNVSIHFNIPYSENLDPAATTGLGPPYAWQGNPGIAIQNHTAGIGQTGVTPSWNFTGNLATPKVNNREVYIGKSPALLSADPPTNASVLTIQFSDIVFPLQVYGMMTGGKPFALANGDKMNRLEYNPVTWKGQDRVNYLGNTEEKFHNYSGSRAILPAAIYNEWALLATPWCFYPLKVDLVSVAPIPESVQPPVDVLLGTIPDQLTNADNLVCGPNDLYTPFPCNWLGITAPAIPNINEEIGLPAALDNALPLVVVDPAVWKSLVGEYSPEESISPFLLGLYIRIKNLPNRAIMGSINQTSDKLVAIVNRYDQTNQVSTAVYPTYSYNEYEKIYVNLNNPAALNISSLDLEIVDKFGTPVKALRETMLSFHLRPAAIPWIF